MTTRAWLAIILAFALGVALGYMLEPLRLLLWYATNLSGPC